jgi:hypothetical protein
MLVARVAMSSVYVVFASFRVFLSVVVGFPVASADLHTNLEYSPTQVLHNLPGGCRTERLKHASNHGSSMHGIMHRTKTKGHHGSRSAVAFYTLMGHPSLNNATLSVKILAIASAFVTSVAGGLFLNSFWKDMKMDAIIERLAMS